MDEATDVCSLATKIWAKHYGAVRASGSSNREGRRDRGCHRSKQNSTTKPSMARWFRMRREQVDQCTLASRGNAKMPAGSVGEGQLRRWTETHERGKKHLEDNYPSKDQRVGVC